MNVGMDSKGMRNFWLYNVFIYFTYYLHVQEILYEELQRVEEGKLDHEDVVKMRLQNRKNWKIKAAVNKYWRSNCSSKLNSFRKPGEFGKNETKVNSNINNVLSLWVQVCYTRTHR